MRKAIFLILTVTAFAADFIFAEEIKLTDIVSDQRIIRGERGAIGDDYRTEADGNIPANGLIVKGNVGIGTKTPGAKLHVSGTAGTDGIMFPDGTLQTTAFQSLKLDQEIGITDITLTSLTRNWADMDDMSITLTTTTGKVLLLFSAWFYHSDEMTLDVRLKLDTLVPRYSHIIRLRPGTGSDDGNISLQYLFDGLLAGTYTFKVQWRNVALRVGQRGLTDSPRVFTAIELP